MEKARTILRRPGYEISDDDQLHQLRISRHSTVLRVGISRMWIPLDKAAKILEDTAMKVIFSFVPFLARERRYREREGLGRFHETGGPLDRDVYVHNSWLKPEECSKEIAQFGQLQVVSV